MRRHPPCPMPPRRDRARKEVIGDEAHGRQGRARHRRRLGHRPRERARVRAGGAKVVVADIVVEGGEETVRMIKDDGRRRHLRQVRRRPGSRRQGARRQDGRDVRQARLRAQQRRHRGHGRAVRRVHRGELGPHARHQPQGRLVVLQVRDPRDAQAGRRRDREHVVGRGSRRLRGHSRRTPRRSTASRVSRRRSRSTTRSRTSAATRSARASSTRR